MCRGAFYNVLYRVWLPTVIQIGSYFLMCSPISAHFRGDPRHLDMDSLLQRMLRVAGPPHDWDPGSHRHVFPHLSSSGLGADLLLKLMESRTYTPRNDRMPRLCMSNISNTITDARFSNETFWTLNCFVLVRVCNSSLWIRKTDVRVYSPKHHK
jgi:hypothetical protein